MKIITILILFFILAKLLTPTFIQHFQIDSINEPEFKTYRSDEASFLKTFYLMKKGQGYYQAFKEARENFSTESFLHSDVFTWRMPTSFYLWKICCQSGEQILTFFIFLSLIILSLVYLIMKKIVGKWAILSVLILLPYFYDSLAYKTAFLFTEWWAFFFFVIGLFGLFKKYNKLAMVGFFLAVITRELFIIPLLFMFIYSVVAKENWRIFVIPIVGFLLIYLLHAQNIANIMGSVRGETRFDERFHMYKVENLQAMMSFSMRQYVINSFKTHFLLLLLGIISLTVGVLNTKNKYLIYLLLNILSFLVILPFISVLENDYWGIMFVPLILISIPLIFTVKIKK